MSVDWAALVGNSAEKAPKTPLVPLSSGTKREAVVPKLGSQDTDSNDEKFSGTTGTTGTTVFDRSKGSAPKNVCESTPKSTWASKPGGVGDALSCASESVIQEFPLRDRAIARLEEDDPTLTRAAVVDGRRVGYAVRGQVAGEIELQAGTDPLLVMAAFEKHNPRSGGSAR